MVLDLYPYRLQPASAQVHAQFGLGLFIAEHGHRHAQADGIQAKVGAVGRSVPAARELHGQRTLQLRPGVGEPVKLLLAVSRQVQDVLDGKLESIIVLTGDQGLAIGSHGLLGKENMYDHSIASPLIYAGPGIPAGGRSAALVHHVDLFPTLCELTGVPRPASARDGYSLAPLLRGEADQVREAVRARGLVPRSGADHRGK